MTWRADLKQSGYALFPELIPPKLIAAAKNAVEQDISVNYDPAHLEEYEHQSWCPALRNADVMMALLKYPAVWHLLEDALGRDKFRHGNAQIAIRKAHNAKAETIFEPHLDGVPSPYNGVKGDQIDNFTVLVGIYLSDTPRTYAGNFTVWPGSHKVTEKYFRDMGPKAQGMGTPQGNFGEPTQLIHQAGDVVLCHYQLMHSVSTNTSDVDRFAVYFRISLKEIGDNRWEYLTNIWDGWRSAFLQLAASRR